LSKATDQTPNIPLLQSIKHLLSKEQQLYFERVVSTIKGDDEETTHTALEHVRQDTGHQQLVPYFVQFITEEVRFYIISTLTDKGVSEFT
jgi:transcription initiation factor TFIID subunit 6